MAKLLNDVKLVLLRGLESVGNKASQMAHSASYKVSEINLEARRHEILGDFALLAYDLWQRGERLPDALDTQMRELSEIDEKLAMMRAQRFAEIKADIDGASRKGGADGGAADGGVADDAAADGASADGAARGALCGRADGAEDTDGAADASYGADDGDGDGDGDGAADASYGADDGDGDGAADAFYQRDPQEPQDPQDTPRTEPVLYSVPAWLGGAPNLNIPVTSPARDETSAKDASPAQDAPSASPETNANGETASEDPQG